MAELLIDSADKAEVAAMLQQTVDQSADDFSKIREFFELCVSKWQAAYNPGTVLTADESMVFWVGTGSAHLTYLPRKPTPLGIMLKTICDASSGVMLGAEICESKEAMSDKKWVKQWGATTATTMRLVEPHAGKGRILIADSWFGSTRTAYALRKELATFCICNVK